VPYTLAYLNPDDEAALLAPATHLVYSPGDTIVRQGAVVPALFLIRKGRVQIKLRDGHRTVLAQLEGGDVFGEVLLLDDPHAPASYIAIDEVDAAVIDREDIEQLVAAHPDFGSRLFRSLAQALARRWRQLTDTVPSAF
jgi:CRP-like cAMP-binding protein